MIDENKGWICPRCNKVNAPSVKSCDCVEPIWVTPYFYYYPYYPNHLPYYTVMSDYSTNSMYMGDK